MPDSLKVLANGLEHHVLEWPSRGAAPGPTVLLLHGYMDAAATWQPVAPALTAEGFRVLAPDLRGYGDGARVPPGGYYHFPDYVLDVADLVEQLVPAGAQLYVVGHSMGGTIANMFTGTFPERVTRLALLEGAGPPDNPHEVAPDRMRKWVEVRDRLDALARELPDGGLAWKSDPLHGTRSPMPFFAAGWAAFARRITCPVLFVSGGPLGWHPQDEDARVSAFATLQRAEIPNAGHMMHWTEPAKLTRLLLKFFADDVIPGALSP
jgi:pimeloyl-ACP methyl ester carboxylesterase